MTINHNPRAKHIKRRVAGEFIRADCTCCSHWWYENLPTSQNPRPQQACACGGIEPGTVLEAVA